jgi:hypothetical protein
MWAASKDMRQPLGGENARRADAHMYRMALTNPLALNAGTESAGWHSPNRRFLDRFGQKSPVGNLAVKSRSLAQILCRTAKNIG